MCHLDVVPQKFPSLYLGDPKISVKDEPENEIVSLLCVVPINETVRQWKNVTYEIEWYTDGKKSKFREKRFCKPQKGRNENNDSCPGEKTIHSLLNGTGSLNYYTPGQRVRLLCQPINFEISTIGTVTVFVFGSCFSLALFVQFTLCPVISLHCEDYQETISW